MTPTPQVPRREDLYNPVLQALRELGGSGTIDEITQRVISNLKLSNEVANQLHDPDNTNETELEYRLAWARTYLKNYGILEKSGRGVWAIKPDKQSIETVDPQEVNRHVASLKQSKQTATQPAGGPPVEPEPDPESPVAPWRERLYRTLINIAPDAFERLTMRLLRECGFDYVVVTGRSGDGGIDGKGIARMAGVLSFHVVFQCKRYRESLTSGEMRDFRGAMVGRADKGLFITTGRFTRDAVQEATRDGAPPIELVDGDRLADLLLEHELGIQIERIERPVVDESWFLSL